MLKEIRRIFLVGIFTAAPLALTVYLFIKLFTWFDQLFQPAIQPFARHFLGIQMPGLGIVVGLGFIFFVGLIAPSIVGKQFLFLTERMMVRLPLAKYIYSGTKQIFDSFSATNLSKFNRVILVPFPDEGTYSVGFVTQELQASELPDAAQNHNLVVFVPTTPNPTSGYILFVKEDDTIPLSMSVDEALKFIISIGFVKPLGLIPSKFGK